MIKVILMIGFSYRHVQECSKVALGGAEIFKGDRNL